MDTNNTNNSNNQNNTNSPSIPPQANPNIPNAANPNTNNTNNQPQQQQQQQPQNRPQQGLPQNFNLNVTMAPPVMSASGSQERGLFHLHHNMMQIYCRYFGPRARILMEYTAFVHAITLLILVVVFHMRFVGKSVDCIPAALVANNVTLENVEVLQIQIVNSQTAERLQLYDRFLSKGKDAKQQLQNQKEAEKAEILFNEKMEAHSHEQEVLATNYATAEVKEAQVEDATDSTEEGKAQSPIVEESSNPESNKLSEMLLSHLLGEDGYKTLVENYKQISQEEEEHQRSMNEKEPNVEYFLHEDWEEVEEEEDVALTEDEILYFLGSPTFLFATERAYLMMGDDLRVKHNVSLIKVSIPSLDECFSSSTQRAFLEHFVGFDTIMLNSLAKVFRNKGYVYSLESFELYSLNAAATEDMYIEAEYLQLQTWQPARRFLWLYFMKSMAVMMIGSGTWLVLSESLGDRGLAFLVLGLVWFSEFFVMISIRTSTSVQFFPSFFFLYFLVFHLYYYAYPFGFTYLAFFTWVGFTQHLVLFFLNRFEIPAIVSGTVNPNNPRPGSRRPNIVLRRPAPPGPQQGVPGPAGPMPQGAQPQPGGPGIRIPIPPGAQGISLRIQPGAQGPQRGFQILIPQGRGRPPFPPQGPFPSSQGPFPMQQPQPTPQQAPAPQQFPQQPAPQQPPQQPAQPPAQQQ